MSLKEKEKQLDELRAELQLLDDQRMKIVSDLISLNNEVSIERMLDVKADHQNVILYSREHWEKSSEAFGRYLDFWSQYVSLSPKEDRNSKIQIKFSSNGSENLEKQISEIESFLPFMKDVSYPYVESCKGDVASVCGKAIEVLSNSEGRTILVIKSSGEAALLSQSFLNPVRIREKTRFDHWKNFLLWIEFQGAQR